MGEIDPAWTRHPEQARKGEANGNSKLTALEVEALRRAAAEGASFAELGRRFGVADTTAAGIVRRRFWR